MDAVISEIVGAQHLALSVLIICGPDPPRTTWRSAGYRVYEKLDRRVFATDDDPLATVELAADLSGIRTLQILEAQDEQLPESLDATNLDVLLCFASGRMPDLSAAARYGVWWCHHADVDAPADGPPYFWELHERTPTIGSALLARRSDGTHVLYRSRSPNYLVSLQRARGVAYWKTGRSMIRRLTDLHSAGWEYLAGLPDYARYRPPTARRGGTPTNTQTALHVLRIAMRVLALSAQRSLFEEPWFLAYRRRPPRLGAPAQGSSFTLIEPPRGFEYADPFVIDRAEETYIFFECAPSRGKGVISYVKLRPDGGHGVPHTVLEQPHHLSYPFIFEHEADVYMVPEALGSRTLDLYRAVRFPDEWELVRPILTGIDAADPTILHHDGRLWLFTNVACRGGNLIDELFLFSAESLNGEWTPHPMNPIVSDARRARPAGRIFTQDGMLVRPSQDCGPRYGYAVNLNRIDALNEREYREETIATIAPDWRRGNLATHSYSVSPRYEVLDGRTRRGRLRFMDALAGRRLVARRS